MKMHRGVLLLLAGFLLTSCASSGKVVNTRTRDYGSEAPATPFGVKLEPTTPPTSDALEKGPPSDSAKPSASLPSKPAEASSGLVDLGQAGNELKRPLPADQERRKVVFEFDKADIVEVTNKIFQDYLQVNYVLDPNLQGRVSLYIEGEFTNRELLNAITKAYAANLVSVVPRGNMYLIQPLQRNASSGLPIAGDFVLKKGDDYEQPIIVMYRLRFLEAKQAVNTIRMFLAPGRPITVDDFSNSVVFAEDIGNARTIINILKAMDMNIMKDVGMEVVPLQALTAEEAATSVETLLGKLDTFKQSAFQSNVAVIPLQHFGGVLILAQDPEVMSTIKNWLHALDLQGVDSGEQIYVYYVQNGLATEISDILGRLYGEEGGSSMGRRSDKKVVGSNDRSSSSSKSSSSSSSSSQTGVLQNSSSKNRQSSGSSSSGTSVATKMTGNVVIIPDETNNAIVVRANQNDYAKVKKSIQSLDVIPRGVLIEVTIAEVTLNNELEYGVEWFLKNKGVDIAGSGKGSAVMSTGQSFTKDFDINTTLSNGLTLYWENVAGNIAALINLLSSKTDVSILSNPTLLATDNKEASITVGGREPIVTKTVTSTDTTDNTIANSIEYEETGIILTVTPHINAGGLVRLDVEQTIRDAIANTVSGIDSPAFTERKINTTLIAQNGSTVVIGGIIQTKSDTTHTGVPFLDKVPLIAPLFSSKDKTMERTELIIAITPRVVDHNRDEISSREFLEKMKQLRQKMAIPGADGA